MWHNAACRRECNKDVDLSDRNGFYLSAESGYFPTARKRATGKNISSAMNAWEGNFRRWRTSRWSAWGSCTGKNDDKVSSKASDSEANGETSQGKRAE